MINKVPVAILYPTDVFGSKIGGIDTFIKGFIKFAPEELEIELIGITEDSTKRPVGRRIKMELEGSVFTNNPVLYLKNSNIRSRVPLSLKYTFALWKHRQDIRGRILQFHRIEPSVFFQAKTNKKIFFSHGNIQTLYNSAVDMKWKKFPWLYFFLEKYLIKTMKRVFVVNEDGRNFYKNLYPNLSTRFHFFPTWVDDEIFYPYSSQNKKEKKLDFLNKIGLKSDSKIILFAGRLETPKNPMLLLETFRLLWTQNEFATLFIVGDGSLKLEMENHVNHFGMSQSVQFLGTLSPDDLAEMMRISDLFLLTSAFEGMPRITLESLACGLPVVMTDVGGMKRIILEEYSGIVVNDNRPEIIAEAIKQIFVKKHFYKSSNCVNSVRPYFVRNVLGPLYNYYIQLIEKDD